MRQVWRFLRVVWTTFVHTLLLSIQARRLPPEERLAFRARRQHVGCQRLCELLGVEAELEGEVDLSRPMLIVCNHFGVLDPIVLASRLPVAFAAKSGIRSWFFVGWVCTTMGVFYVERESRTKAGAFVDQVRGRLRRGVSVLVFPEGSTTRARSVRPFKTGAFESVADLPGAAVLPIYLDAVSVEGRPATGAVREEVVWADGSPSFLRHFFHLLGLHRVEMRIRVGEPIATEGKDRKELAQIAHARVAELAERAAEPVGSA